MGGKLRGGIECYHYYYQLGSFRSDQPDEATLWDLGRFVDEVEQVRQALGLDRGNFVLLGQSWGGLPRCYCLVASPQRAASPAIHPVTAAGSAGGAATRTSSVRPALASS